MIEPLEFWDDSSLYYVELISLRTSERNILSLKSFMLESDRDWYLMIYNLSNFLLTISLSETLVPGVSGTYIFQSASHINLMHIRNEHLNKTLWITGLSNMGRKLNYHVMVFYKIICLKNNFCV